ncbi:MAG: hypothetical protein AAAC48_28525, partial [Phyllobacterium sp.]
LRCGRRGRSHCCAESWIAGGQTAAGLFRLIASSWLNFRQVESPGESLVITDHGKPVLEVGPYRATKRNALEMLRGSVMDYERPH